MADILGPDFRGGTAFRNIFLNSFTYLLVHDFQYYAYSYHGLLVLCIALQCIAKLDAMPAYVYVYSK